MCGNDDLAAKRRRVFEDPIGRLPPSAFGDEDRHLDLDLDPGLFVTNIPPRSDAIPFSILHPVFAEFEDNAQIIEPDDADCFLVRELQTAMTREWDTELEKCEEFRGILARHYTEIVLWPAQVGGTGHVSGGHFGHNGLLVTVLEGRLNNGRAQFQGSMYILTALREKVEKLDLLNRPFHFPCIIITLDGTRCCLFWKQKLTSAPSQKASCDSVVQSSRRASNLK